MPAAARAAVLAALVAGCGCGERGPTRRGAASPADAGTADAGVKRMPDAGQHTDAGDEPDDPGWVALPDVQPDCVLERATQPEAVFPPPIWEPCPDRPGCQRLVPPDALQPWVFPNAPSGAFGPEGGVFHAIGYGGDGAVHVLARVEGPPIAAWRQRGHDADTACSTHPYAASATTAGFMLTAGNGNDVSTWDRSLFFGTYEEIGRIDRGFALEGDPESISVSPSMVGLEYRGWGRIGLYRDGGVHWMEAPPAGMGGSYSSLQLIGDHAFWWVWGSWTRIAHGSMEEATSIFLETASGDIKGFATDGVDMAWLQAYDRDGAHGDYARVELWTAPYTQRPADLAPRKLRDLPQHENTTVVSAGYWIRPIPQGDSVILDDLALYDLRDGRRRLFHPGEMYGNDGTVYGLPPYVTPTEVLVGVDFIDPGDPPDHQLWRIEMDSIPYEE